MRGQMLKDDKGSVMAHLPTFTVDCGSVQWSFSECWSKNTGDREHGLLSPEFILNNVLSFSSMYKDYCFLCLSCHCVCPFAACDHRIVHLDAN